MMANVFIDGEHIINKTHIAKVKVEGSEEINVSVLPSNETRFALLANLFFCEGIQSKVLSDLFHFYIKHKFKDI